MKRNLKSSIRKVLKARGTATLSELADATNARPDKIKAVLGDLQEERLAHPAFPRACEVTGDVADAWAPSRAQDFKLTKEMMS